MVKASLFGVAQGFPEKGRGRDQGGQSQSETMVWGTAPLSTTSLTRRSHDPVRDRKRTNWRPTDERGFSDRQMQAGALGQAGGLRSARASRSGRPDDGLWVAVFGS
jgi:hypothetical protein